MGYRVINIMINGLPKLTEKAPIIKDIKLSYLPKDYPILALNVETGRFAPAYGMIYDLGLLKLINPSSHYIKDLLQKQKITPPFYVFMAEKINVYKNELIAVPKLVNDNRNLSSTRTLTFLCKKNSPNVINHEFG